MRGQRWTDVPGRISQLTRAPTPRFSTPFLNSDMRTASVVSYATFSFVCCLAVVFGGPSCDFLEPEPKTFVESSSYYQTADEAENGINAIYGKLQDLYDSPNYFFVLTELRSDNTTVQWEPQKLNNVEFIDEFQSQATNPIYEDAWSNAYSGIQQANIMLNRLEGAEFGSQEERDQYAGEAKFLRALFYFHLVRLWGEVPLVLDELGASEAFTDSRASAEAVYEQIIADATDAANSLPLEAPASEAGRATVGAARTLLGTVYMTQQEFESAIEPLQQVAGMDYELLPDYEDVFDPANKNHAESIFEVQYEPGLAGGEEASSWIYRFAPSNSGSDIIGFSDLNDGTSGFNIPTVDMVGAYEQGDERKATSISFYVNPENSEFETVAIGDSIPFINKYNHAFSTPGQTRENWPVYRYSQVLLMLAEALNEVGRTGDAYAYVNQVRERAGLDPLAGLSKSEFRQAVYHELRVELAFENHRWYNLKRTERALEVMREHGQELIERSPRITEGFYNIEEYKLLYPIPFREVRLNDFEQNPGW